MISNTKYNRVTNYFTTVISLMELTLSDYDLLHEWSTKIAPKDSIKFYYNSNMIGETTLSTLSGRTLTLKWKLDPTWIGYSRDITKENRTTFIKFDESQPLYIRF